jgi:hypothetical protein
MKKNHIETLPGMKKGFRRLLLFMSLMTSLLLTGCSFVDDEFWLTYPSDYEGVELWLDAERGVGLDIGTGSVLSWKDQSRNRLLFNYATTPPTLTTDSGKTVVYFTGSEYLNSTTGIDVSNNITLFFVAYIYGSTGGIISCPGSTFSVNVSGPTIFQIYPPSISLTLNTFNTAMHVFEMRINVPDVKATIDDGFSTASNSGLSAFSLNSPLNIGADYTYAGSSMFLAELIICGDSCSDESIDGIRNYLKRKYGIDN